MRVILRPTLVVAAALVCVGAPLRAQNRRGPGSRAIAPVPLVPHRTGAFDVILPIRSPESDPLRASGRFQFPGDIQSQNYDLTKESSNLYVPADYRPDGEPFGLVVWESPVSDGSIPDDYRKVFDDRHVIWIGANNAGNDRAPFTRVGLALDAVASMLASYHIDPARVFVSGLSGGGRVSSMLAVAYPDVFAGGFPIIGINSFLRVRLESNPNQLVPMFSRPAQEMLDRARAQPFVVLTGSGDFNREECRLTAQAYAENGFTNLHLIDVDGMGHEMPSAEDFARGLDLLLTPTPTSSSEFSAR